MSVYWKRARARIATIRQAVTALGMVLATLSVVAVVGWLVGGWAEFGPIGVGGVIALAVAALFLIGRAGYEVTLDLRSSRVVVGERATGRLEVASTVAGRQRPSRMELPVGVAAATLQIPGLSPGEVHEELFVVPTHRRAVIPVGPARSVRGDAVGLLRRVQQWTGVELLYVHPRTVALDASSPGLIRDLEGQVTPDVTNSDVSFHALRGYVPGDDRRYIHWRTSARTGVLMVRQFEQTRRSHMAVAVSTATSDYADADQFELAVEAAASVGVQAFREERRLSLVTSEQTLPAPTAKRLLDQFSGVERADGAAGVIQLARRTIRDVPDVSIAILLCGSEPTPAQIRSAVLAFPVDVRVVVIRSVPGAQLTVRQLARVPIVTIGHLEDLPLALRRVRAA